MEQTTTLSSFTRLAGSILTTKASAVLKNLLAVKLLVIFMLTGIFANAQFNKMLIGDNNNGQIVIADIDGSNIDTVDLGGIYQSFYDADIDPIHEKIYMAWYYGIYSMNYDGSDFDTLVFSSGGGYSEGVAVDAQNGYIYWGSTQEGKILRAKLDGTNQIVLMTGLGHVADVDIDHLHGYLFYSQSITSTKGVYRADLDGSNSITIAAGYDATYLGLNDRDSVIYFSDGSNSRKMKYDGTGNTHLFSFQPGGFLVDTTNSLVYYTSVTGNKVIRTDLSGGNSTDLITTQLKAPFGPVLFNSCFSIVTQPADQNKIVGENALFTVKATVPNLSFQWQTDTGSGFYNIINGGQYSGATDDSLKISSATLDNNGQEFRCVMTSHTCSDTSNVVLLNVTNSGINEGAGQNLFSIYPNPAKANINLRVALNLIGAEYSICDQLGRKLIIGNIKAENSVIDLANLPEGIYIFSIGSFTKQSFTIIKK